VAAVARDGLVPARPGAVNRNDVPVLLLVLPGVAGSVFALLVLLVPSGSTSYGMLSAVTVLIIVVMYGLMLAAPGGRPTRHTATTIPSTTAVGRHCRGPTRAVRAVGSPAMTKTANAANSSSAHSQSGPLSR
jgi:hypothetical protein